MWTCHRTLGRGGCLSRMFRQTLKYCRKVQEWKKIDNIPFIYLIFVYIPAWEGIYVRRRLKMRVRSQIALRRRRNVGQAVPTERKDATTTISWAWNTKTWRSRGLKVQYRGTHQDGLVSLLKSAAPTWSCFSVPRHRGRDGPTTR